MMEKSKYKLMRSFLFYDLPMENEHDTKAYTKFRNNILRLGYTSIQNSVYIKVHNSKSIADQHIKKLRKILPVNGNIRLLILTEKQYNDMLLLVGVKNENELINDTERFKII